jgi:hypothetical protein
MGNLIFPASPTPGKTISYNAQLEAHCTLANFLNPTVYGIGLGNATFRVTSQ